MAMVKVYLYDYYDGLLKRDRRSTQFATADAIMEKRATVLAESERLVDEDLLQDDEHVRAADMPPRDLGGIGDLPRTPPGETRMGPG
jgi:hypothetical protein